MSGLLWWGGITWDTSVRDIGWMWVLLAIAVVGLARAMWQTWKEFR